MYVTGGEGGEKYKLAYLTESAGCCWEFGRDDDGAAEESSLLATVAEGVCKRNTIAFTPDPVCYR